MRVRVLAVTGAAVLSLTLSGCITVHGENAVLPATTEAEAKKVLDHFVTTNNKANRTYDVKLSTTIETGAQGAIDAAGLRALNTVHKGENPNFQPLELTDARYHIPQQAGWPKFFVADTEAPGTGSRVLLVFLRNSVDASWKVSYLAMLPADQIPKFAKDEDGYLEDVPSGDSGLLLAPEQVAGAYTGYLKDGKSQDFAPGDLTDELRAGREKNARTTTLWNDFIDQPAKGPEFAPAALRTEDGRALVFFSTLHYEKQTAAEGRKPPTPSPPAKALMTGNKDPDRTVTYNYTAGLLVSVPEKGAQGGQVRFLDQRIGLTGAKGS